MIGHFDFLSLGLYLAQQGTEAPKGSPLMQFLPFLLIIAAMYFLLIVPQQKKQKEHDKMVKSLKAGDEVMTAAGIYGKINSVKEDRVVVTIGENTKVEMNPTFVQQKIVRKSAEKSTSKK